MKNTFLFLLVIGSAASAATLVTSSVDGGGNGGASASYSGRGCLGGFAGIGTAGSATNSAGFLGQLAEVDSLVVSASSNTVAETGIVQFSGVAVLDDGTRIVPARGELSWSPAAWPLTVIDTAGVATAAAVYTNVSATVTGRFFGVVGTASVLVLDALPDNFGSYAGDGLPDGWQVGYFGVGNSNALPGVDANGTGVSNLFKYVAGLDPTNPASVFQLRLEPVDGQPLQKRVFFSPRLDDRRYGVLSCTNIGSPAWQAWPMASTNDNGTERALLDTNAVGPVRFYRIQIFYP
jgi:hypothetical protein